MLISTSTEGLFTSPNFHWRVKSSNPPQKSLAWMRFFIFIILSCWYLLFASTEGLFTSHPQVSKFQFNAKLHTDTKLKPSKQTIGKRTFQTSLAWIWDIFSKGWCNIFSDPLLQILRFDLNREWRQIPKDEHFQHGRSEPPRVKPWDFPFCHDGNSRSVVIQGSWQQKRYWC